MVAACTKRTRDAVTANEDIKDVAERRAVQMEILNATVTYLEGVFGTDTPSTFLRTILFFILHNLGLKNSKQVAELLADVYPAMFKDAGAKVPIYHGYGFGGVKGCKGLPERICNMVFLILIFRSAPNVL